MLAEPATAALAADKSFKIAEDMIKRHAEEVGDELPALVTSALCYWHRAGRSEEDDVSSEKQASWCGKSCGALSACADAKGDQEIVALLKEKNLYTLERDAANDEALS